MPSVYIGINLPIFTIALLPAENLFAVICVTTFLLFLSYYCFYKLNKMLVSDSYLLLDEKRAMLSESSGKLIGEISPFSIVTAWFVLLKFKHKPSNKNQFIMLSSLSKRDKKRLLRAVYQKQ
ncbi:hypothetical protein AAEU29_06205 [Pseudoalteromonas sp. SSM20]|uniref:hypothetical protein n=1 Tax=Pseudoalteromonas sp. SSM20 TaxID=3139394 RepID=UPI003BA915FD